MSADSSVGQYYDDNAQREWERHERRRIEYAVTLRVLDEHLPRPPARVLDIGGGPGRYAIALAERGYHVVLADISQPELRLAEEKARAAVIRLEECVLADARDLSMFADASFDAVLIMGPLYHLLDASDRQRAVAEASRVLRVSGRMFAAFITRYAVLRFWARYDPARVTGDLPRYEDQLRSGEVRGNVGFTDVYIEWPQTIRPFMESAGLQTLDLVGCEGGVSLIDDRLNELTGEDWERWVDLHHRMGKDPSTHGIAEHLLYVGEKQADILR